MQESTRNETYTVISSWCGGCGKEITAGGAYCGRCGFHACSARCAGNHKGWHEGRMNDLGKLIAEKAGDLPAVSSPPDIRGAGDALGGYQ